MTTIDYRTLAAPFVVALAMAGPALAQDTLPPPRPMEAMRGTCADFALNVTAEAEVWQTQAQPVAAAQGPGPLPAVLPSTLSRLSLHPAAQVAFVHPPEQDRSAPERHSGLVSVILPQAGRWRVAASNGVWIDAVQDGALIPSGAFEMQTQCRTPFKVVIYDLPAGEVVLQLNGSPTPEVDLVVLPWR